MAVDRATRLVQQLLALARLEPDAAMGPPTQVDLCEIVMAVVQEWAPFALRKDIALDWRACERESASVTGYADLLRVLLSNVVDNAIRYVPAGGHVKLEVVRSPERLVLHVADDGPGIAPVERERMLEPFVRGRHPDVPGSGLGLSIVKRVANIHDAKVFLGEGLEGRGLGVRVVFLG